MLAVLNYLSLARLLPSQLYHLVKRRKSEIQLNYQLRRFTNTGKYSRLRGIKKLQERSWLS